MLSNVHVTKTTQTDSGSGTIDTVAFPLTAAETASIDTGAWIHAIKIVDGADKRTWMIGSFTNSQGRIDTV